eukprot:13346720-Alexandrium_andersonii.AAC.1
MRANAARAPRVRMCRYSSGKSAARRLCLPTCRYSWMAARTSAQACHRQQPLAYHVCAHAT